MGIKVSREFIKVEIELVSLRVCKSLGSGSKVTSPVCAAKAADTKGFCTVGKYSDRR